MYTSDRDEDEVLLRGPEINYTVLGSILLDSARSYLAGKSVAGTWDGLVHGKKGKLRAERLIAYLKYCGIEAQRTDKAASKPKINEKGLLALLMAIFGEASSWIFRGRSSRLAGLIARQLIIGDDVDAIDWDARAVPLEYSIFYYFDPIWGVRSLLRQALSQLSPIESSDLKDSAKMLDEKLINESLKIKPDDLVGHADWVSKRKSENKAEPVVYAKHLYAEPIYAKPVDAVHTAGSTTRESESQTVTLLYGCQQKLLSDDNKALTTIGSARIQWAAGSCRAPRPHNPRF